MQPSFIDPPEATRLEHELELRRRGHVPISASDALFRQYERLLPRCRVPQVLPGERHSRLVWSHPGRSGLDPRAVAPLAIVRIADGCGPDPLDEPVGVVPAARWLLDGEIEPWLTRRRHRLLMGRAGATCLLERTGRVTRCLTHVIPDRLLQDVADALGDRTMRHCYRSVGTRGACFRWKGPVGGGGCADLLRSAFGVTGRLAEWYRTGVTGTPAWELARHGVRADLFHEWERAGFSVEEAALWCSRGTAEACALLRARGRQPVEPVVPLPLPAAAPDRGLNGYDRWQYTRRGWTFGPCPMCGAMAPTGKRCRTCKDEDRTTPLRRGDWTAYQQLEELGDLYVARRGAEPVPCGGPNCQTPLALSAVGEGART